MKGNEMTVQGKKCYLYPDQNADVFLIQAIGAHDLAVLDRETEHIKRMAPCKPFTLAAFLTESWNDELSPWEAPAVFGNEGFGSGAVKTMFFITDVLLPLLRETYGEKRCYLGGYSLSGLFSLWAAYQTGLFDGVAAVSPSVWFPGWKQYMESHVIQTPNVYLSLGDKEEKTRNKVMAAVGENMRLQYELLRSTDSVKHCKLEWNPGNHFTDPEQRTAKGFAFLINQKN